MQWAIHDRGSTGERGRDTAGRCAYYRAVEPALDQRHNFGNLDRRNPQEPRVHRTLLHEATALGPAHERPHPLAGVPGGSAACRQEEHQGQTGGAKGRMSDLQPNPRHKGQGVARMPSPYTLRGLIRIRRDPTIAFYIHFQ